MGQQEKQVHLRRIQPPYLLFLQRIHKRDIHQILHRILPISIVRNEVIGTLQNRESVQQRGRCCIFWPFRKAVVSSLQVGIEVVRELDEVVIKEVGRKV